MNMAGLYKKSQVEQAQQRGLMRRRAERELTKSLSIKGQLMIGTFLAGPTGAWVRQ